MDKRKFLEIKSNFQKVANGKTEGYSFFQALYTEDEGINAGFTLEKQDAKRVIDLLEFAVQNAVELTIAEKMRENDNGEEFRVGDVVYCNATDKQLDAMGICRPGSIREKLRGPLTILGFSRSEWAIFEEMNYRIMINFLTHEKPDSIEKFMDDLSLDSCEYMEKEKGLKKGAFEESCRDCPCYLEDCKKYVAELRQKRLRKLLGMEEPCQN